MSHTTTFTVIPPLPIAAAQLRTKVQGEVILPDDAGYDAAQLTWNHTVTQPPVVVVIAKNTADVTLAVQFARQHQLGIVVQAAEHEEMRLADGCLFILTKGLPEVQIIPSK